MSSETRAKALELVVARLRGLPILNVTSDFVLEEAAKYDKFICGDELDNSDAGETENNKLTLKAKNPDLAGGRTPPKKG